MAKIKTYYFSPTGDTLSVAMIERTFAVPKQPEFYA
jgi:hypothetical protein